MDADQLALGLALGAGLGLVFAALGAGGGVLAVPVLLYVFHRPMEAATGTSLAILFGTALVSALSHGRRGNVDVKIAVTFGGAALLAAPAGALLHRRLPEHLTVALFSAVLLVAAARMGFSKKGADDEAHGRFSFVPTAALGLGIGAVTGLLGVGGGFLIVPSLSALLGVPVRRAIGTSAAIVCASSLSGAVTYGLAGSVELPLLAVVGGGALLGAVAGVPLSQKLPEQALRKGFAVVAVLVSARMIFSLL